MFFEKPEIDFTSGAIDQAPGTMGEIWDATYRTLEVAHSTLGWQNALEETYERRISAIFEATGQKLDNPMRVYVDPPAGVEASPARDPSAVLDFQTKLDDLARQFPNALQAIGADRPVHIEARALSREAEGKEQDLWDRTPGAGKYLPYLGANLAAAATDPVNILALLPVVGEVGIGARAVIWGGVKAGAANAAAEALAQPFIQGWRSQAGLDAGLSQAATQVAVAGLFGFAADAGIRGTYRGVRNLGSGGAAPAADATPAPNLGPQSRDPMDALEEAARASPEGSSLRRAVDGDDDALIEVARTTGAMDNPAVRGAVAELERRKMFGEIPDVDRGEHAARMADAIRQSMDPEAPPAGDAIRVRAPSAETAADPRIATVRTALDGGALLRDLPDAAGALPLSPHKLKQAVGLSRLSDAAWDRVAAGDLAPHYAALIGNQVVDQAQHSGLVAEMAAAGVKSEKAAKLFLGQALAAPTSIEAHAVRFGAGNATRELMPERVAILDRALNGLGRDKRIRAVLEREAPGVKGKALTQPMADLVARVAETPGRVSELLQKAAADVANGMKPVDAAKAFRAELAEVLERDGTRGLLRETTSIAETQLGREGFGDPVGAAAKAQLDELKAQAKERENAYELPKLKKTTDRPVQWGAVFPGDADDARRRTPGFHIVEKTASDAGDDLRPDIKDPRRFFVHFVDDEGKTRGSLDFATDHDKRVIAVNRWGEPEEITLFVDPEFRGKNVARELFEMASREGVTLSRAALEKLSLTAEGAAFANRTLQRMAKEDPARVQSLLENDLDAAKRTNDLSNVTKACRS